jgi:hypothetical protein
MKTDRLVRSTPKILGNEFLKVWNSTPETFDYLKNVAMAVLLSILSSTYLCLFPVTSLST